MTVFCFCIIVVIYCLAPAVAGFWTLETDVHRVREGWMAQAWVWPCGLVAARCGTRAGAVGHGPSSCGCRGKLPSRASGAAWARVPTTRVPGFPARPRLPCAIRSVPAGSPTRFENGVTSLFGLLDYWNSPERAWLKLTCKQPTSLAPLGPYLVVMVKKFGEFFCTFDH